MFEGTLFTNRKYAVSMWKYASRRIRTHEIHYCILCDEVFGKKHQISNLCELFILCECFGNKAASWIQALYRGYKFRKARRLKLEIIPIINIFFPLGINHIIISFI